MQLNRRRATTAIGAAAAAVALTAGTAAAATAPPSINYLDCPTSDTIYTAGSIHIITYTYDRTSVFYTTQGELGSYRVYYQNGNSADQLLGTFDYWC